MALNISPEKMAEYRAGHKKRQKIARKKMDKRFELAWETARLGAELLRSEFQVEKVIVFGSLTNRELFHIRSDIDLAVWGLPDKLYFRASGVLLDLSPEFSVDLVPFVDASDSLRKTIETEGVEL
ncbi:MAG: nucleotidyltransferase domain-containing protein [Chloroflexi bacterium]|nr:nucleotidyltransferase domain-containing protein [Chloroflexota bacterium]